ncbi:MAG: J domain-containing protein [Planctomycetota bacterium]|nr:J domain-containing protein [Planctomycetota bacterium]
MAEDYYKTLGISRSATPDDIQKAYRDLARKYHPDLNQDDKSAKEKFLKVQTAFEVLNDGKKRKLYDQYGADFDKMGPGGPGGPGPGGANWGGGGGYGGPMPEGFEGIDISQLFGGFDPASGGESRSKGGFGDFFEQMRGRKSGGGRGKSRRGTPVPGTDLQSEITIPFQTAILGGTTDLTVERDGKREVITVKIPVGIADRAKIRLRGKGESGRDGAPDGDILLTIHVASHPFFLREGDRLNVKLPVTLGEALRGAKVDVPTPYGTISLHVPPRTSSGRKLRVKGHGVKHKDGTAGDLYAEVQIMLPAELDEATIEAIQKADEGAPNPRRDLRW